MDKKISSIFGISVVLIIAIFIGGIILMGDDGSDTLGGPGEPINPIHYEACTQEAKVCPDGSSVGRTGPNCEFAECSENMAGPDQVVLRYYKNHIEDLNDLTVNSEGEVYNPDNFDSYSLEYVTENFINNQNKISEETQIPPDTILCAQDYPDNSSDVSVEIINKNDLDSSVLATPAVGWPSITVSVIKNNGSWKIDSITCSKTRENNLTKNELGVASINDIKFSYPKNWEIKESEVFAGKKVIQLFSAGSTNKEESDLVKKNGYLCLDFREYKKGTSWINDYNFENKENYKKEVVVTKLGDLTLHYSGEDDSISSMRIYGLIPLAEKEIEIGMGFNCVQADNELLENKKELFKSRDEYREAIDVIKSIELIN